MTFYMFTCEGIINKSFDCDSDSLISVGSRKEEKKELLGLLVKLYTDAYFKVGTLDTAQLVAANNVPVFQYRSEISNNLAMNVVVFSLGLDAIQSNLKSRNNNIYIIQ